jgi:hypothetical protein
MQATPWAQTNTELLRHLDALGWRGADLDDVRRGYALASLVTAGKHRASGRSLLAHVVGVADVVAALGHGRRLVLAALMHTSLMRGGSDVLIRVQRRYNRRLVGRELGADVVGVIWRFSGLPVEAVPEVRAGQWVDPDVAVLQLANLVEELDTGAEFLRPHHRERMAAAAALGAERAAEAGDLRLAELLEASAAQAAKAADEYTHWLVGTPGPPIRVQVGWGPRQLHSLAFVTPRLWRRARRLLRRA